MTEKGEWTHIIILPYTLTSVRERTMCSDRSPSKNYYTDQCIPDKDFCMFRILCLHSFGNCLDS